MPESSRAGRVEFILWVLEWVCMCWYMFPLVLGDCEVNIWVNGITESYTICSIQHPPLDATDCNNYRSNMNILFWLREAAKQVLFFSDLATKRGEG